MIINTSDKFYPEADKWMWNYCIFLGKYTSKKGNKYDLGAFSHRVAKLSDTRLSAAIVFGNNPGDYYSGHLPEFYLELPTDAEMLDIYRETFHRANLMNIK